MTRRRTGTAPRARPLTAGCRRCPRLAAHLRRMRTEHPAYHNAPVPGCGATHYGLLVVGLAPGQGGANRTGIPFTGDASGELLYASLAAAGLAASADASGERPVELLATRITNAVKCLPPGNRPDATEVRRCLPHLVAELAALQAPRHVLALGRTAHDAVLRASGRVLARHPFAHGAEHDLDGLRLFDSYHCSRLNVNTGRMDRRRLDAVVARAAQGLQTPSPRPGG